MKKKLLLFASATALSLGTIAVISNENVFDKADAYTHISSLPSTIYLRDNTASEIRDYYSSINDLSAEERRGTNLLKNLKPILKNNQEYYSYDSGDGIWKLYEIIDRDWDKSKPEDIGYGTYNSSTKTITGYKYGSSYDNPYVHALYINRNVTNETRAWGNHNQDEWGINREHIWPKSHGFGADGKSDTSGGARGDPMHLWAGNGYSNNIHSNYFYGFVNKNKSYTDCGSTYSNQRDNLLGTSLSLGSGTVFEPQDCDKGDIARAIFYMAARYNYFSGSDSDGIDANNPNLLITDASTDPNGTSKYDSTTTKTGNLGIIRDLLAWNRLDQPDEFEIHRNNLLFNNYTKNRNPFIDFPEWAEYIWGNVELDSDERTITSYTSSSTGVASPNSDVINAFSADSDGISISKSTADIHTGSNTTINAISTDSSSITWTTSNSSVVSLSSNSSSSGTNITLTANHAGSATITAKATINAVEYSATCAVTVTDPKTLSSIAISGDYATSFDVNDEFVFNGTVTATYSDSTEEDVTNQATFSGYNMSVEGNYTVTASFTYEGVTKTTTYAITVNAPVQVKAGDAELYSGALTEGDYVIYYNGKAMKNSISSKRFTYSDVTSASGVISEPDDSIIWHIAPSGDYWTIYNESAGKYAAGNGTKNQGALIDSVTDYAKWTLTGNSTYDFTNLGNTNDSVNATLRNNGTYGFACYSTSTGGALSLYRISDATKELTDISISGYTTTFTVGDEFSFDGTVTATYSDTSEKDVTSLCYFTGYNMNSYGSYIVTVTYTESSISKTATYQIDVNEETSDFPYQNDIAYKLYFTNTNTSTSCYFNGNMKNTYYGDTSTSFEDGVYVYFETNDDGRNMYFYKNEVKTYIYVALNGTHKNFTISEEEPKTFWTYDESAGMLVMSVNETLYAINGYGSYTTFSATTANSVTYKAQLAETAESYSYDFLRSFTCDGTGNKEPVFKTGITWNDLSSKYSALDISERNILTNANRNKNGTIIEQCVARYDLVVINHDYTNFMSRTLSSRTMAFLSNNNVLVLSIILTVSSTVSLLAFFLFVNRKRKHQ